MPFVPFLLFASCLERVLSGKHVRCWRVMGKQRSILGSDWHPYQQEGVILLRLAPLILASLSQCPHRIIGSTIVQQVPYSYSPSSFNSEILCRYFECLRMLIRTFVVRLWRIPPASTAWYLMLFEYRYVPGYCLIAKIVSLSSPFCLASPHQKTFVVQYCMCVFLTAAAGAMSHIWVPVLCTSSLSLLLLVLVFLVACHIIADHYLRKRRGRMDIHRFFINTVPDTIVMLSFSSTVLD